MKVRFFFLCGRLRTQTSIRVDEGSTAAVVTVFQGKRKSIKVSCCSRWFLRQVALLGTDLLVCHGRAYAKHSKNWFGPRLLIATFAPISMLAPRRENASVKPLRGNHTGKQALTGMLATKW